MALGATALVAAFTVFRPPATPGPIERDFEAYYAAGATINAGGDPYSRAVWAVESRVPGVSAARDELLPFVGPAAALPLWSLLARLPYVGAAVLWTALLAAGFLTVVTSALVLAGGVRVRDRIVTTSCAALALAAAPTLSAFALGQAALVSAGGIAAALVAYRARRAPAALAATLVAAIQPNLAFALVARMVSRWDAAVATGAAAVFLLAGLAYSGGAAGLGTYLRRLGAHATAERFVTIQHTPAAVAHALGVAPAAAAAIGAALAAAAAVTVIVAIVRERFAPTDAVLLSCALMPFVIPFFHEHDFVIDVLPVTVLALRAHGRPQTLAAVAAALVLTDWFGLAQRHGAAGQILCLGLAVVCAFRAVVANPRETRRASAGIFAFAACAAIAVPLAITHPAPTWPDNLPAAFHADSHSDASAVWAAEAHAAGLDRADPVWGALRAIPLVGCTVLAAALIGDVRARRRASARAVQRQDPRTARPHIAPISV